MVVIIHERLIFRGEVLVNTLVTLDKLIGGLTVEAESLAIVSHIKSIGRDQTAENAVSIVADLSQDIFLRIIGGVGIASLVAVARRASNRTQDSLALHPCHRLSRLRRHS